MSWIKNILPGIGGKKEGDATARSVPEGVWEKCRQCGSTVYSPDKEKNLWVCPMCDYHDRITASQRAQILFDEQPAVMEIGADIRPLDVLKFDDGIPYEKRLHKALNGDAKREAVRVYRGAIKERLAVAAIFDFSFMGGSMGSVVGERFVRGADAAISAKVPFLSFSASGGARMQEGMVSLLQMAKTTAALAALARLRLPYISVLTDPTTGGVAASFAMLGDIVIAEPNAIIGFAGPRVIQETVREALPEGFQRSEFLRDKGAVDMIVGRYEMRDKLSMLMSMLARQ